MCTFETITDNEIKHDSRLKNFLRKQRDAGLLQVLKDTIVTVNNPNIPLPYGTPIFSQVFGLNANGTGPGSVIIMYTTTKASPTDANVLTPANNATKVSQPVSFTNSTSINAEKYEWQIKDTISKIIVLDTILNNDKGFTYNKLTPGKTYSVTVQPQNSDQNGNISAKNIFTIIKNTPGSIVMTNP